MRIVNVAGRLGLVAGGGIVDVATASGGRFSARVQDVYDRWSEFRAWARDADGASARPPDDAELGSPAPAPRQVFGIGLNYLDHAEESAMDAPTDSMVVFTKFPSSITGAFAEIALPAGSVDFEAELVVVIGAPAYRVSRDEAWDYVAGLTAGQDISERELQLRPPTPQFSLGKSYPGFAPMGPELVTVDEFEDRDDLELGCTLNGDPDAAVADEAHDLPGCRDHREAVRGRRAPAGRRDLHRHALGHRVGPRSQGSAPAGRRAGDDHPDHRIDAQPLRRSRAEELTGVVDRGNCSRTPSDRTGGVRPLAGATDVVPG